MTIATQLPIGQKMALLIIRRNTLADRILTHLREMTAPEPTRADYAELFEDRRIVSQVYFRGEQRFTRLALTPGGLHSAGEIMRDYAVALGIHDVSYTGAVGTLGPSVRCTCGWGTHQPRNNGAEVTLIRYADDHMAQAKAGTLPEPFQIGPQRRLAS